MQKIDVRELIMEETKRLGETRYIEALSVKEICEKCGISRPTFYTYFKDKYDLVNEIYHSTVSTAFRKSDMDTPWQEVLERILRSIKKNRKFYFNSVKYAGQNAMTDMMLFHTYKGYLSQVTARTGSAPDDSLKSEIRFNAHGSTGLMIDWIRSGMVEDPHKLAAKICSCMPERMAEIFFR